jgi:hypothetical protein
VVLIDSAPAPAPRDVEDIEVKGELFRGQVLVEVSWLTGTDVWMRDWWPGPDARCVVCGRPYDRHTGEVTAGMCYVCLFD